MNSRATRRSVACLVSCGLTILGASGPAAQQSIYQRKADARAQIGGSPKLRDGAFQLAGVASICGEIPKEASLTGQAVFLVEFPGDSTTRGAITNVTFSSSQLVSGVTKASTFRLSVAVVTANGGRPPQYVLNTDSPKNSGTATLSTSGGTTTLRVVGQEVMGETIDLTVTCS